MPVRLLFLLLIVFVWTGNCTTLRKSSENSYPVVIVSRADWAANTPRPFKHHVPVRMTVHHEGTKLTESDNAADKIRRIQVWGMGPDRNWTDIPYHFLIAPDGTIYEGRDVFTVGETNTEYDPTGHLLICCLGNLQEQQVPEKQLASLVNLVAYCSEKYNIPLETLATHRDYSQQTSCPGKYLYKYFQNGYVKSAAGKIMK